MEFSRTFRGLLNLLAIALIFWVGFEARNSAVEHQFIGSDPEQHATLSVSGSAEKIVVPDVAQVVLGVETKQATARDAQAEVSKKMKAVTNQMKKLGIDEQDLQTRSFRVDPVNRYDRDSGTSVPDGFRASQTLQVKIRETDKASEVIDQAVALGANSVEQLRFVVDDEDAVRREILQDAIADAKDKAEELADDLDVDLVRIVSFSHGDNHHDDIVRYETAEVFALSANADTSPQIEAGSSEITAQVTLTYEVR